MPKPLKYTMNMGDQTTINEIKHRKKTIIIKKNNKRMVGKKLCHEHLVARLPTMRGLASYFHERLYNCKGLIGREEDKEGWRWREGMTPKGSFPLFWKL